jgi:hypothetical protein
MASCGASALFNAEQKRLGNASLLASGLLGFWASGTGKYQLATPTDRLAS